MKKPRIILPEMFQFHAEASVLEVDQYFAARLCLLSIESKKNAALELINNIFLFLLNWNNKVSLFNH